MGRSRGGLTTKIHTLVDANGRPIRLKLTEGHAHDGRSAADMFDTVDAGRILLADRAYDSDSLRQSIVARGAWANSILTRTRQTFALKSWALKIAKRRGLRKACVVLARRLAVIMHAMLRSGTLLKA